MGARRRRVIPALLWLVLGGIACDGGTSNPDAGDVPPEGVSDEAGELGPEESGPPEDAAVEDAPTECPAGEVDCFGACVDLDGSEDHCGTCGNLCWPANAVGSCEAGACVYACNDGWTDPNANPVDGCEYACRPDAASEVPGSTCENGLDDDCDGRVDLGDIDCADCVPELCNGLDDDCDGLTDEDIDYDSDILNCGGCNVICPLRVHAAPICILGECDVVCQPGWADLDRNPRSGCEAACTSTGGAELECNGVDDDCDGRTDEDWRSAMVCGEGPCERSALCAHGAVDCRPRLPPALTDATCDGLDDDCDGVTDDEGSCMCVTDVDCDDGNPCTADTCAPDRSCIHEEAPPGVLCPEGECCGRDCVDSATDPLHCGDCDNVCSDGLNADAACVAGACGLACRVGWYDHDGAAGCEYACAGTPVAELCNGADDDCNGATDDGFTCSPGELVECPTTCGSEGGGPCTVECERPVGLECVPPAELCNGADDDCDTVCDDGSACCLGQSSDCTTTTGAPGVTTCGDGCVPGPCLATMDVCNAVDDDDDTLCDEDFACCRDVEESRTCTCGGSETRTCDATCNWEAWSGCPAGDCTPATTETRTCTCGGSESRTCDAACGWGAWSGCTPGACVPGTTESRACTCGGSEMRTCLSNCTWGAWSGCATGTCTPGATQTRSCTCGGTERRTCSATCSWGAWSGCAAGVCTPGTTRADSCDSCSQQTCTSTCTWSACALKPGRACEYLGGHHFRCCGTARWQYCLSSCVWSTDCASCTCTNCPSCC